VGSHAFACDIGEGVIVQACNSSRDVLETHVQSVEQVETIMGVGSPLGSRENKSKA